MSLSIASLDRIPKHRRARGRRSASALLCAVVLAGSATAIEPAEQAAQVRSDATSPRRPPGSVEFPPDLASRLWAAYEARGRGYEPRTRYRLADGDPVYVNRLILEDSPYLIQHAHNPVNWFPWGPEAFETARREDKPIFLSIGYSTCHWCHVMEEESFDNEAVARFMNEAFVSIKVDREQRPDVDDVYMTAVQLIAGRGGWPMSSFLTGDGKPFFGGTYYPEATFVDLLEQVRVAWRDRRPQLLAQSQAVAAAVERATAAAGEAAEVGGTLIDTAAEEILSRHDDRLGGFSPAPKFPHEPELLFLLDRALRSGDQRALAAVEVSLDHMARGGLYDQLGGGFHRYSTDARWLVPHFEKMLYNQAHLARAYLEAFALTGNPQFERVARQTLDYVLRDMTTPQGAFYSATDADSEGREGAFFVWTPAELRAALAPGDSDLAIRIFGVSESGNFEGASILNLPMPLTEAAESMAMPLADLYERIDRIRDRLYQVREERIHPLRDHKIVTAWNAMMVTSLARAGDSLGEPSYLDAARRAAAFLWRTNRRQDGRLWRIHLDGRASIEATLNDYAYLAEALVTLYDVTGEARWLERSRSLAEIMVARLWDEEDGGFFVGEDDHGGRLPVRPKSPTDGAIPSGNSVALRALAMLSARTEEPSYQQRAERLLAAFSSLIERSPSAFSYMLLGAEQLVDGDAGALGYAARGTVRARAALESSTGTSRRVSVLLEIADGWHVNSDRPLQEDLVPTRLAIANAGWALRRIVYPEAKRVTLGFQTEPVAVFEGGVTILVDLAATGEVGPEAARLELTVQACDDRKCLRPEALSLELALPD